MKALLAGIQSFLLFFGTMAVAFAEEAAKEGEAGEDEPDLPQIVPTPKHSLTFTLRSSLRWPEGFRHSE